MDTHPEPESVVRPAGTGAAGRLAAEAAPVALVAATAWILAWRGGSIAAGDWLAWTVLAALGLATLLLAGGVRLPPRPALAGLGCLLGLAVWDAVSLSWAPVPSLARDEALLVFFFALAAALPLVGTWTDEGRLVGLGILVAGTGTLAVATAVRLLVVAHPADLFDSKRLSVPIGYANAQAAVFVLTFFPAVAIAAQRRLPPAVRAAALACGTAGLTGWVATQSKGGGLGLAVAAVVFFAVSPNRLRASVPTILSLAIVGLAYLPLTAPFRASDAGMAAAIRRTGTAMLVAAVAAALLGVVYALVDRRVSFGTRARAVAGRAAAVVLLAALGSAAGLAAVRVRHPIAFASSHWREFKQPPAVETGSSHFTTIGSYRYDMWRVAAEEFRAHPVAGIGARGFGVAYLQKASLERSPQRAHSLELEALSETGVVGFVLLVAGLAGFLVAIGGRISRRPAGAAVLAAAAGWLAQASVDWTWTVPAAGLPFFALLGLGASGTRPVPRRAAAAVAIAVVAIAIAACVPPWLAARYVSRAYAGDASWERDLDRAHTLDPLSVAPYVARALLAPSTNEAVHALRTAIERQPRSVELYYLLGRRYLAAGRPRAAVAPLERALQLSPHDSFVRRALARARQGG